jgi:hypothetical protein
MANRNNNNHANAPSAADQGAARAAISAWKMIGRADMLRR